MMPTLKKKKNFKSHNFSSQKDSISMLFNLITFTKNVNKLANLNFSKFIQKCMSLHTLAHQLKLILHFFSNLHLVKVWGKTDQCAPPQYNSMLS